MKKQNYGLRSGNRERKIRWWLPITIALWAVAAMTFATQFFAMEVGFHPAIGSPVVAHCYFPWSIILWNLDSIIASHPGLTEATELGMAVFMVPLSIIFMVILTRRPKGNRNLHGTATWAKKKDLGPMGLTNTTGVYVGGFAEKNRIQYLLHNGPEHVLAFAPTRSGKGVGLVIPTLLAWEGSTIVLDIKGENYALSSGYRRKKLHHTVFRFDPASPDGSARFNPLAEVRLGTSYAISDVQNIASMICDPDGKGLKDYFSQAGYAFLTGLILHVLVVKDDASLADVVDEITRDEYADDIKGLFYHMTDTPHAELLQARYPLMETDLAANIERAIHSYAGECAIKADRELSGVISTAVTNLSLYRDPTVARNTKTSDFRIDDIMNSEKPIDLYLVVSPADLDRLRPLLRIFFNLALRKLTATMEFKDGSSIANYKHRLLLMLDEFTSLGRLEIMQRALAFMAGYGIKAYIIVQDLTQLQEAYTRDESITSNCHVRIAYAPNKIETAKLLSDMTGKTTVVDKKTSISGKRFGHMGSASVSISEVARPLLTPDECMRLKGPVKDSSGEKILEPGDMLIFVAGFPAIYGRQMLYFLDPVLSERSRISAGI
ncbi:type IV secretory system conjugative DNA transfer family protein [Desulforhopalus singaporensis]|uniref:Type IV secretion system protein VirD4 n=1 Tax=Desulforhopalus singaporensis TaxID=91360 RepID=A0A1H0PAW1_9BACT|nr:type IV secretory system conjugative DNA transfer family protein [Desulforhopalus singaporensis]SDP01880.1 type IV secretion system protein VirD4 [Desulforhopalus singaporensis]